MSDTFFPKKDKSLIFNPLSMFYVFLHNVKIVILTDDPFTYQLG